MKLGAAHIIQGNALNLPLPDASVDACITSPPYFGLRAYQDNGQIYEGQLGSEATPAEFLDALIAATREMVRVLKPSGSIFVNLGDKYSSGNSGDRNSRGRSNGGTGGAVHSLRSERVAGLQPKTLIGIPWRYAIRCIDELGLILRAEIIWAKPNGLPESVTDRVRRSHEQWFHLVRQPRYFAAVDEIRVPQMHPNGTQAAGYSLRKRQETGEGRSLPYQYDAPNPLGKLPGSVWSVPTQPLTVPPELGVDHFAAYPMEWPRRIIQGWTPNGICTQCGEGRRAVATHSDKPDGLHSVERRTRFSYAQRARWTQMFTSALRTRGINPNILDEICGTTGMAYHWTVNPTRSDIPTPEQWEKITTALDTFGEELDKYVYATEWVPYINSEDNGMGIRTEETGRHRLTNRFGKGSAATITGYMCACPTPDAPTTPAIVLDPFGGTGTTALVAKALGRTGITVDLSHDYSRLAQWRCNNPGELAAALQVEKPEPVPDGQLSLFGEATP